MSSGSGHGPPDRVVLLSAYDGPYRGSFIPMLESLVGHARDTGRDAHVVLPDAARQSVWAGDVAGSGARVHWVDLQQRRGARDLLDELLGAERAPTVLHSHFTGFDMAAASAGARHAHARVVWHVHSPAVRSAAAKARNRVKYLLARRGVDGIYCVAQNIADSAIARGAPRAKVSVVPNAIDTSRFPLTSAEAQQRARAQLGVPEAARVVLHLGWDWHRKGGDLAVAAVRELVGRGETGVLLVTVGGGEPAREAAQREGVGDHVLSVEPRDDAASLYACADAFLSCSREEGMPFSMVEALCAGLPVVATDIPGQAMIARGVDAVRLVDGEAGRIAGALGEGLAMEPQAREAQRLEARELMESQRDLVPWAQDMMARYGTLFRDR